MNKIAHVSKLPAWFELKNYDGTKSLDATGWLVQLLVRGIYLHDVKGLEKNDLALIEHIQKNPLSDVVIGVKNKKSGYLPLAVKELTDFNAEIFGEHVSKLTPSSKHEAYLALNLNAPDALLIKQFKALLKDIRARDNEDIQVEKRRPDFDSWIKTGVLPYLDLNYWANSQNVQITNRCMADAIFTHGEGGEEVVRKTTRELAEKITGYRYIRYLHTLVQDERSENKTR